MTQRIITARRFLTSDCMQDIYICKQDIPHDYYRSGRKYVTVTRDFCLFISFVDLFFLIVAIYL